MRVGRSIVAAIAAASILNACIGGFEEDKIRRGVSIEPHVLFGEISFEGWRGPIIGGATLLLRVYDQSPAGTKGSLVTEHTERGLNMDPGQQHGGHPFAFNVPPLEKGESYLIEVHIDIDHDGVPSSGDAVSVELLPFEAKEPLDAVVIPVARVP